jgi:hypothetical protein
MKRPVTPARIPVWCLVICFVAGLTLLATTTCPHVSWFGQTLCGAMGAFLILTTVTGFTDVCHVERLARITRTLFHTSISGARHVARGKSRCARNRRTAKRPRNRG